MTTLAGLKIQFNAKRMADEINGQVADIFKSVLTRDIPSVLKKHNLEDPKDYTLLLKNRGKVTRRQLSTIQPRFLRLGRLQTNTPCQKENCD